MADSWNTAIERLYDVFSIYRRPQKLDTSPVEDPTIMLRELSSQPLRALPANALSNYSGSALYTVGSLADFKHFLPRILELSFSGSDSLYLEGVARKLVYAEWTKWPNDERTSIQGLLEAGWFKTRDAHPDILELAPVLAAMAILDFDISIFLAQWQKPDSANAVLQMAELIKVAARPRLYWLNSAKHSLVVLQKWAKSETVRDALETGALTLSVDEDELWRVESALIEAYSIDET